jgi:undecaprenyl-diphosphatase
VLWWSDARGARCRALGAITWKDVLVVGLAQALALIPGTSRSGVTISAGLILGFTRREASRYSFLLSIPVIALAGGYESLTLARSADPVDWPLFAVGVAVSAVSAYLCVAVFLRAIERIGMLPFVLYRFVLGALLLLWFAPIA